MELKEAKAKFLQAWGTLGSNWGISRSMAQVHALLLVTEDALSTEDIMEELSISRGNANMNIRGLMDWGLVKKELKPGERREFFSAEKDIWEVSRLIARERHKRELEPALKMLAEMNALKDTNAETKAFKKRIREIHDFTAMIDKMFEKFIQSNNNWFLKLFAGFMK